MKKVWRVRKDSEPGREAAEARLHPNSPWSPRRAKKSSTDGNQAVQHLTKSGAGGAARSQGALPPVNRPGDAFEQEAELAARKGLSLKRPSTPTPIPGLLPQEPGRQLSSEVHSGAGADGVRLHDSPEARSAAQFLGARAFTVGSHIWLGPGESETDRELVAHELAHVDQQASQPGRVIMRQTIQESLPPDVELQQASLSFQLPGGKALTGSWNDLSTTNPTTVSLIITPTNLQVVFRPALRIDAQWPVSDMEWSGLTYDFATASISTIGLVSTQDVAVEAGQGTARTEISNFFINLLAGTRMASPGYNPLADSNIAETLGAIRTNFTSTPSSGGDVTAADVTNITLSATIGLRAPIHEGTPEGSVALSGSVTFTARLRGTAAELAAAPTPRVEELTVVPSSMIIQKDGADVAQIHALTLHFGGQVTLGRITLLGAAAEAAETESGVRGLLLILMLASGRPEDRLAVSQTEPRLEAEIVPGLARSMLEAAITRAAIRLIRENSGAIPGIDLDSVFGVGTLGDFPPPNPNLAPG